MVAQAEQLQGKENPRSVVTSLGRAEWLARAWYEQLYGARGEMENRSQEPWSLFRDRLSTETRRANPLRLYFSSLAYVLGDALRRSGLRGTAWATAQVDTLRLKLLKIAAQVRIPARRLWVCSSAAYPWKHLFASAWLALRCGTSRLPPNLRHASHSPAEFCPQSTETGPQVLADQSDEAAIQSLLSRRKHSRPIPPPNCPQLTPREKSDWIRSSAPPDRVNWVAVIRPRLGGKEPSEMIIIGCDFHSRFQQIAMLDPQTGEIVERRLVHDTGEAHDFYATLPGPARVGMEATIDAQWFEKMLSKGGHELWVGDAAEIRAAMVRKQKTDSRDALHILDLLLTYRFPRIWIPSPAERDIRQMVRHRHKLVRFRTSVMNQLHALAMSQGLCRKSKLWTTEGRRMLERLALDPWASRRRRELLQLFDQLGPWIEELDQAVIQEAESRPEAVHLMTQPGVGPVTALAFVLTIGPVERFRKSKQVVSYLGLNPSEASSGGKQRLGAISKQGNSMTRYLLTEAAQTASKFDPELRRDYQRLKFRRGISGVAKVAIARKLAVRLYWKLREAAQPVPPARMQGSPTSPVVEKTPSRI